MDPDEQTIDRIKNLAVVGTLLRQGFSEQNQDFGQNFFFAKDALNKFKAGIDRLKLDPPSQKGMSDLVSYLMEKIEKREKGISK